MLARPSPLIALGNPKKDGLALWNYIQPFLTKHKGPEFPTQGWVPGVLGLPRVRELEWNEPWVALNPYQDSKPRDITALLVYLTGEIAPEPCRKCRDGKGPFKHCVMMAREAKPGPLRSVFSCSNCFYHYGQTYCTHKGWGERRGAIISELMMKTDPESLSKTMDELLLEKSIELGEKLKVAAAEAPVFVESTVNDSPASATPVTPAAGETPTSQPAQAADDAADDGEQPMAMDVDTAEMADGAEDHVAEDASSIVMDDPPNPVWERYGHKAIEMAEPERQYAQWRGNNPCLPEMPSANNDR